MILNLRWRPSLHRREVATLGETWRKRHYNGRSGKRSRCHPSRHQIAPPHFPALGFVPLCTTLRTSASFLRIRHHIVLHCQVIQQIEVGIKIVILFQGLQIAYRGARLCCLRIHDRDLVIASVVDSSAG